MLALLLLAFSSLGLATAAPNGPAQEAPIVISQKRWTILSSVVNHYTAACVANGPGDATWLGTPIGIKRVTPRGSRIYTPLDGLPAGTVRAITHQDGQVWCVVAPDSLPEQGVYLCRWNRATDRWQAQPLLKLSGPLPRLLLSASGKDIYLATVGTGMRPAGSLYRFVGKTGQWQSLSLPKNGHNASIGIAFLQSASEKGIVLGTTSGLFRWQPDIGWIIQKAGIWIYAGVRETDGSWWLVASSGNTMTESLELLHLDPQGAVISRSALPTPSYEGMLPNLSLVETRENAVSGSSNLWVVGLIASEPFSRSGFGETQPRPWVARFNNTSKEAQVVPLETPEDIARVPLAVALSLLHLGTNLPQAWTQRLAAYDSPPSDTPTPPSSYVPSPYRGEAGTEADGSTWDRVQSALIRTAPSGSREEFPLPPIRLPVRGDLSGVALTSQGDLLALTRDSLLQHKSGTAADAWLPVTVPYSNPSTSWYRYGYASRLLATEESAWLATDAFALYLPLTAGSSDTKPALVTNGGSVQTLLGVRKDGSAWVAAGETIQLIEAEGGAPLRTFAPATLPPGFSSQQISPLPSIGGVMSNVVWYAGQVTLTASSTSSALVGYDSQKERWTQSLPCYRVIALRSGIDGESAPSEAAWALIEDNDDPHTLRVMQWKPETGAWERIGLPLPDKARINDLPLRLVRAQPDSVWIVDRDQLILYHWDGSLQEWSTYPAPAGCGLLASNSVAEAGVYAEHALDGGGPAIYVAGLTGLWEFTIGSHTWRAIDLPSVGQWWILRVVDGGPGAAWAILSHPATGTCAGGRFDKKSKAWTIYGSAAGFPTTGSGDYTLAPDSLHPGQACWLLAHQRLYRYDAGHWRDRTSEVTRGKPGVVPGKIVSTPTEDAWVVLGAGSATPPSASPTPLVAQWLRKTDSFTVHYSAPRQQQRISGTDLLPEANGDALLGTTRGVFRWEAQKKAWSRLEIPAFPEMPVYSIIRTPKGLWLLGQDRYAWQRP
ncbi:MAG: hypothetical protein QM758_13485 [Armatimonas sp.]